MSSDARGVIQAIPADTKKESDKNASSSVFHAEIGAMIEKALKLNSKVLNKAINLERLSSCNQ